MINFFRKSRKKLAEKNKFVKYTRYAIGEIVLVVVGILIALWINQQAQYSKERVDEINVLKEIRKNLDSDLTEIGVDITYMDTVTISSNELLMYLKKHDKPNDNFGEHTMKMRTTPHFNPNTSGYNLLTSKGIEIIQNSELRNAIANHYESLYRYYNLYEKERINLRLLHLDPVLIDYFSWEYIPESAFLGTYTITEEDYQKLKVNDTFKKLILSVQRENILVQNRAIRVRKNIETLSKLLDEELAKH